MLPVFAPSLSHPWPEQGFGVPAIQHYIPQRTRGSPAICSTLLRRYKDKTTWTVTLCMELIQASELIQVKWTIQQRSQIMELYFPNRYSVVKAQREFRRAHGVKRAPTDKAIRRWVTAFRQTGSVADSKRSGRPVRTAANIAAVQEDVVRSPKKPVGRRSNELQTSETSLRRIMRKDIGCYPYKVKIVQKLLPTDAHPRLSFDERFLEVTHNDNNFLTNVIMSDEAHFHLDSFTNTTAESGQLRTLWLFMRNHCTLSVSQFGVRYAQQM
jgi:hypothetical protein